MTSVEARDGAGGEERVMEHTSFLNDPTIPKLDRLPEGWVRTKGAQTAPAGWYWANNGKSLFGGERKSALIKEEACKS